MSNPDVSVIVTNWNGREMLQACIHSIHEKTSGVKSEIIVVDDASTDGSSELVRTKFPDVQLIINQTNLGFARANNHGVKYATGRYVLLLNSDTLLLNNAIKVLVDFLETNPDASVCGGCLKNMDLSTQISYGSFPSFSQAIVDALFLNDLFPLAGLPNRGAYPSASLISPREVDFIIGADMLIRREIIDQLGLFDEQFQAYCEEVDLCYRIRKTKLGKVYYVPDAQIIHLGGMSYSKLGERQILMHYSGYNKFLRKHHGDIYALATRLLYAWHHFVKLSFRLVDWLVSPLELRNMKKRNVINAWYTVQYSLFPKEQLPSR
jgi:GT2 family glycosyltransferase